VASPPLNSHARPSVQVPNKEGVVGKSICVPSKKKSSFVEKMENSSSENWEIPKDDWKPIPKIPEEIGTDLMMCFRRKVCVIISSSGASFEKNQGVKIVTCFSAIILFSLLNDWEIPPPKNWEFPKHNRKPIPKIPEEIGNRPISRCLSAGRFACFLFLGA